MQERECAHWQRGPTDVKANRVEGRGGLVETRYVTRRDREPWGWVEATIETRERKGGIAEARSASKG